jgi:hypothetical protein
VNRVRLIDPFRGRTILKTRWGVLAAVGDMLLLAGPAKQFTLLNAVSGVQRRVRWPSIVGGIDRPAVDPRGRFVALAFADPAWNGGGNQALDVWLLDTKTGELTQLPGMPAYVSLKRTSMAWTDDGRLVFPGREQRETARRRLAARSAAARVEGGEAGTLRRQRLVRASSLDTARGLSRLIHRGCLPWFAPPITSPRLTVFRQWA